MSNNKTAVVLFSGGLDSTTVLAIAQAQGFTTHAISFDYNQRNKHEINFAAQTAKTLNTEHIIIKLDNKVFSCSNNSLTNQNAHPENGRSVKPDEIPNTYVPNRNMLFLAHAISYAESIQSNDIFIGVNTIDYGNYPDCREDFIKAMELGATLASKNCNENNIKFNIHTPIINMNKAQIIQTGLKLAIDYSQTLSCYNPSLQGLACGQCLSCTMRKKGFEDAKVQDVTKYQ